MNPCRASGVLGIVLLGALAGCAPLGVPPAPTFHYRCNDDREFSLVIPPSGDAATIVISGMRFDLLREASTEPGERYACSMLTLWRDGSRARVELEGSPQFTNCRPKP